MIIALPLDGDTLSSHFGHCHAFALAHVQADTKKIEKIEIVTAPPHEPGVLPQWLANKGAHAVICGGIGPRAVDLLSQNGIKVVMGAPVDTPDALVQAFLNGTLQTGANSCDH
ncbi:MAG: NifB/NifX family molybdenum-iron cluster-binding protein [Alphaproteobacteria bacterium]|nr:NifB/NifX family molybdenum-iron cluster-binding protein [Alphaproteobacteria bacterium]